jgi:hypothetical protein
MPTTGRSTTKSVYSVHPGVVVVQKWIAELPQKTGRSLEAWIALVKKSAPVTLRTAYQLDL